MTIVNAATLGLEDFGRTTVDGVEYICYWDGAYRHVITAESYDADYEISGEPCDHYTEWCNKTDIADDATAVAVGKALGLEYVTSGEGTCARLDCEEAQ